MKQAGCALLPSTVAHHKPWNNPTGKVFTQRYVGTLPALFTSIYWLGSSCCTSWTSTSGLYKALVPTAIDVQAKSTSPWNFHTIPFGWKSRQTCLSFSRNDVLGPSRSSIPSGSYMATLNCAICQLVATAKSPSSTSTSELVSYASGSNVLLPKSVLPQICRRKSILRNSIPIR
jgi:hypothetical protein